MNRPVVLLTDFGGRDHFAGVMKGVILGRDPRARVLDLSHDVPPQDVEAAAFILKAGVPYFPQGSLFVVVVDPGVGSGRGIIWARSKRHSFLAPDNGVLSWIAEDEPFLEIRSVSERRLWLSPVSPTFHGRDIFAPVAGRLSRGLSPARLGPKTSKIVKLPFPRVERGPGGVLGRVIAVDCFGNAVTNLKPRHVGTRSVFFKGRTLGTVRTHYAAARPRAALALYGSSGFLELSVRGGSFSERFKGRAGDKVLCR